MIKVILADDHNIVRNGIKNLLERTKNIQIVAEANNGIDVLRFLGEGVEADIILADMNMAGMGGIELIQKLKEEANPIKVILLTINNNQQFITKAFQAGAMAYLFKNIEAAELLFAIQQVFKGKRYVCIEQSLQLLEQFEATVAKEIEEESVLINFSERELAILRLMVDGLTNEEIAEKLFTSKRTVEGHRQAMMNRAGVRNTPALVKYVIKKGLID